MTLRRLWELTLAADSISAEFKEYYDFAGEIPPEVIRKLLIERGDFLTSMNLAMVKLHPNHEGRLILLTALERSKKLWPDAAREDSVYGPTK